MTGMFHIKHENNLKFGELMHHISGDAKFLNFHLSFMTKGMIISINMSETVK